MLKNKNKKIIVISKIHKSRQNHNSPFCAAGFCGGHVEKENKNKIINLKLYNNLVFHNLPTPNSFISYYLITTFGATSSEIKIVLEPVINVQVRDERILGPDKV